MNVNSVSNVFSLIKQLTDTKKSTEPLVSKLGEKPPFGPSKRSIPLERSTPEAEGVPSALLLDFIKKLRADKTLDTHNLMILRHGRVILEAAFDDSDLSLWKQTFSACKSITALAVGFALKEGLFTLDTKLSEVFPEEVTAFSKKAVTSASVRHLLTMTAVSLFGEADSLVSDNWIGGYMTSSSKGTLGEVFAYNSMNTYMLSAMICKTSGMSLTEYLKPRLFEPLGIENFLWEKGPDGYEKGGWGMYITPEDMAKIGLLVMNGGEWNGEEILPSEYIAEMTSEKVKVPETSGRFNYGYQTWCGRDSDTFLFSGMLDQNVLGLRSSDILILVNSGNTDMFQQSGFFSAVFECLVDNNGEKLSDVPLPEDTEAFSELEKYVDSCRKHGTANELHSRCFELDGKEYEAVGADSPSTGLLPMVLQLLYNNYTKGLQSISFEIKDGKFYVMYREKDALHRFPVGFDKPKICNMKFRQCIFRVAVSGEFAENEDGVPVLKMRLAFGETPCIRYLKFFFEDGSAVLSHRETPGMAFAADGIFGFKRSLSEIKLLRGAVGMVDDDYLDYRIKKTFAPSIKMVLAEENK